MSLDTRNVIVELSTGASIPLRPIKAKNGNVYHAVLKPTTGTNPGFFGVKVAPKVVGGDLPKSAKVEGRAINGTPGMTTPKDKQGRPSGKPGNPKVTFTADVEIDGQARKLRLQISKLPDGNFNVSGVLNRPGGDTRRPTSDSL